MKLRSFLFAVLAAVSIVGCGEVSNSGVGPGDGGSDSDTDGDSDSDGDTDTDGDSDSSCDAPTNVLGWGGPCDPGGNDCLDGSSCITIDGIAAGSSVLGLCLVECCNLQTSDADHCTDVTSGAEACNIYNNGTSDNPLPPYYCLIECDGKDDCVDGTDCLEVTSSFSTCYPPQTPPDEEDTETDSDSISGPDSDVDTDSDLTECDSLSEEWGSVWTAAEEIVLELVNEKRLEGNDCGTAGNYGPTLPLTMQPQLRCAARAQAKWMGLNNSLTSDSSDGPFGDTLIERIEYVGYTDWTDLGENIAQSDSTPTQVVGAWMEMDEYCANIMNPDFDEIGVGYYLSTDHWWVVDFVDIW